MDYSYTNDQSTETGKDWAIIVLPEIFGLNSFIRGTVDRLAATHGVAVTALDHFYPFTGAARVYDYVADREEAHHAMTIVTGEKFMDFLSHELDMLQAVHPSVKHFAVIGFCFGGRLAYLAGVDQRVSTIVSYYGAGPHTENFYKNLSAVETLAQTRKGAKDLRVLALYGGTDASIPEEVRAKTSTTLTDAGIPFDEVVYPEAGHAFCNHERPDRYNADACAQSIATVDEFLK